jgi:uncharacterized membrane protein
MTYGSEIWRESFLHPQPNVSDTERYLSAAAAAALAIWAARQRSGAAWLLGAASAVLGYRAVTGYCFAYGAAGIDTTRKDTREALSGSRGVHAEAAVTVARPAGELFAFWRRLENLPQLMTHLVSVRTIDDRRSHWVAKAPAGSTVEWDAEIVNEVPNKVIGWRSLEGSDVATAGSVNFDQLGPARTRVRVKLQYDPPGGKLGSWVAWLFGEEPNIQIREDLERFKEAMEQTSTSGARSGHRASAFAEAPADTSARAPFGLARPVAQNGMGYNNQPSTIPAARNPPNIIAPVRSCARGLSRRRTANTSDTRNENRTSSTKWLFISDPSRCRRRRG